MRFLYILIVAVVLLGCKKKEAPVPPERAQLVFPERNSECTTGNDINAVTSQVEFSWLASNNTDTYELIVTNLDNGNKQDFRGLTGTTKKVPIAKGALFSWVVNSNNSMVLQVVSSSTWSFYNSGFDTTYAPFPAEIVSPNMGISIFKDINNEIELSWIGADVDNDIEGFEIYLSPQNPPENLIVSLSPNVNTQKVTVTENRVYYWRVITKDKEGNSSDSGVFEFRAI
jgi:hypothetical protein